MFSPIPLLFSLAVLQLGAAPVAGKKAPVDAELVALVAAVQKAYDNTYSFEAAFEQTYRSKVFKRTERSSGQVAYQRPGRMRFDYAKPTPKTFLVDGKALWIIQPKDHQALVDRCFKSDAMTSSLTFLFGQGELAEQFVITRSKKTPKGLVRMEMVPRKPQAAYQKLFLDVDPVSARVRASTVADPQGNLNRFVFKNAVYDGKLGKERFAYTPPKGITVMPIPGSCNK